MILVALAMYKFSSNQKQSVAMTAITIRLLHTTPPATVPALSVVFAAVDARLVTVEAVEAVEGRHTRNNIFVLGQSQ